MLTKLYDTIFFRLPPLLSALFIAVGTPLLHSALHSHSENHHIISEHCDGNNSAFADEDHEPICYICEFLATSQLYYSGMEPIITENKPAGIIISIRNVFLAKIHPLQTEPRAPPVGNSF
jgi:hypothetical protein